MKHHIFALIVLVFLVFPYLANAAAAPTFVAFNVNVQAAAGDGSFPIHIKGYVQTLFYTYDQTISTTGGQGGFSTSTFAGGGTLFYVTEDVPSGWALSNAHCVSDNPNVTFTNIVDGVLVYAQAFSTINCSFENRPNISKAPILIIPGLFGTDIKKGDDIIWADVSRMVLQSDDFMDPLQFKSNIQPLDTSLTLGPVIRKKVQNVGQNQITLFDYTDGLIQLLISQGYTEGQDLFTFPYDWRYGVSPEVVNQLEGQIQYILTQTDAGRTAGKVDVVAHSTGGLIVKKYVQGHPADHGIGKAVFVGVPNLGAPKAYKAIIVGESFDITGLNPLEMKKIAQNVPIAYDLAPSHEFVNKVGPFLHKINMVSDSSGILMSEYDAGYDESIAEFERQGLLNNLAQQRGEALHTVDFDNYDVRTAGVDLYNIVGCKTGTFGQFTETTTNSGSSYDFPRIFPGDGTVPFGSADSVQVLNGHSFFVPGVEHGKLFSGDGSRQLITNLLTGSSLPVQDKVLTRSEVLVHPEKCKLTGKYYKVKSPVSFSAVDQNGNEAKVLEDGAVQNDIPGASYEVWGDHKYIFLPDDGGQTYDIHLKGTGTGTFSVEAQTVQDNTIIETKVIPNVPVTPALSGELTSVGGTLTISLDTNSDGTVDQVVQPVQGLDQQKLQDEVPPVTTVQLEGTQGQSDWYRSVVNVTFNASDVAQQGASPSGVAFTRYSLDGAAWHTAPTSEFSITSEGAHELQYYSVDNVGNEEPPQAKKFTIDITAPEAALGFDIAAKDLQITGKDALDAAVALVDMGDVVRLTDKAGNVTLLGLSEKDRKKKLKAELVSLSYNGLVQDLTKSKLAFAWGYTAQGALQKLDQQAKSKKDFNVSAVYNGTQTKVTGKDASGTINQLYSALKRLQIETKKGDLVWQLN